MKYLIGTLIAYGTVISYFALLNRSTFSIFAPYLVLILILFFIADFKTTCILSVIMGVFMDLHFVYIGLFTGTFIIVLTTIRILEQTVITRRSLGGIILLTSVATIEFYVVFAILEKIIYGWSMYGSIVSLAFTIVIGIVSTLLISLLGIAIVITAKKFIFMNAR